MGGAFGKLGAGGRGEINVVCVPGVHPVCWSSDKRSALVGAMKSGKRIIGSRP